MSFVTYARSVNLDTMKNGTTLEIHSYYTSIGVERKSKLPLISTKTPRFFINSTKHADGSSAFFLREWVDVATYSIFNSLFSADRFLVANWV
jgi:hypothetical protein